jgi:hypothetical protein
MGGWPARPDPGDQVAGKLRIIGRGDEKADRRGREIRDSFA